MREILPVLREVRRGLQKEDPWLHLFGKNRFGDKEQSDEVPHSGNGRVATGWMAFSYTKYLSHN
jgi:hypothetical protein